MRIITVLIVECEFKSKRISHQQAVRGGALFQKYCISQHGHDHKRIRRSHIFLYGWRCIVLGIWIAIATTLSGGCMLPVEPVVSHPSSDALTLDALYDHCGRSTECGKKLRCEGERIRVTGYIDYGNVFDKEHYPRLPYQKFLITNAGHTQSIEVWVDSALSRDIFQKIHRQETLNPKTSVMVQGVIEGFDMPIMGACHRGIKLNLKDPNDLTFHPL